MRNMLIVTPITIVIIAAFVFMATLDRPTLPTSRTSDENLRRFELVSLDPLYVPGHQVGAASDLYLQILDLAETGVSNPATLNAAIRLAKDALTLREVEDGFLDQHVPLKPFPAAPKLDAFGRLINQMAQQAMDEFRAGRADEAMEIGRAGFAMAHRTFLHNQRLLVRGIALESMLTMTRTMAIAARNQRPTEAELADRWDRAIEDLQEKWAPKYRQTIFVLDPNPADMIRIALRDADLSFRQEATLHLGRLKFKQETRSNIRMIDDAIAQLRRDGNPTIQEAARVADEFTREDFHRMSY